MNRNRLSVMLGIFTIVACLCLALPVAASNLLADGSFENPNVSSGSTCGAYGPAQCLYVGETMTDGSGAGWTVVGLSAGAPAPAPIMLMTNTYQETVGGVTGGTPLYFHVQDGSQAIDLTGEGNQIAGLDGIKQSVTLNPGQYDLSFWLGRQDTSAPGYLGSANTNPASISLWIGQPGQNAIQVGLFNNYTGGASDVAWQQFHYDFSASGYTTIAFLNNTALGNNYAGLDNVVLTQTPEPSSLFLLASGFVGLFATRFRK